MTSPMRSSGGVYAPLSSIQSPSAAVGSPNKGSVYYDTDTKENMVNMSSPVSRSSPRRGLNRTPLTSAETFARPSPMAAAFANRSPAQINKANMTNNVSNISHNENTFSTEGVSFGGGDYVPLDVSIGGDKSVLERAAGEEPIAWETETASSPLKRGPRHSSTRLRTSLSPPRVWVQLSPAAKAKKERARTESPQMSTPFTSPVRYQNARNAAVSPLQQLAQEPPLAWESETQMSPSKHASMRYNTAALSPAPAIGGANASVQYSRHSEVNAYVDGARAALTAELMRQRDELEARLAALAAEDAAYDFGSQFVYDDVNEGGSEFFEGTEDNDASEAGLDAAFDLSDNESGVSAISANETSDASAAPSESASDYNTGYASHNLHAGLGPYGGDDVISVESSIHGLALSDTSERVPLAELESLSGQTVSEADTFEARYHEDAAEDAWAFASMPAAERFPRVAVTAEGQSLPLYSSGIMGESGREPYEYVDSAASAISCESDSSSARVAPLPSFNSLSSFGPMPGSTSSFGDGEFDVNDYANDSAEYDAAMEAAVAMSLGMWDGHTGVPAARTPNYGGGMYGERASIDTLESSAPSAMNKAVYIADSEDMSDFGGYEIDGLEVVGRAAVVHADGWDSDKENDDGGLYMPSSLAEFAAGKHAGKHAGPYDWDDFSLGSKAGAEDYYGDLNTPSDTADTYEGTYDRKRKAAADPEDEFTEDDAVDFESWPEVDYGMDAAAAMASSQLVAVDTLSGHTDLVISLEFTKSVEGALPLLISASFDDTIRLWTLDIRPKCLAVLDAPAGLTAVKHLSARNSLILCTADNEVVEVDMLSGAHVRSYTHSGEPMAFFCMAVAKQEHLVAVGGKGDSVYVWDTRTDAKPTRLYLGAGKSCRSLAFDSTGQFLLTGGRRIGLWDVQTGELAQQFPGHSDLVDSVCFGAADTVVYSNSREDNDTGSIRAWSVVTGECLAIMDSHTNPTNGRTVVSVNCALSENGQFMVTPSVGGSLVVYDTITNDVAFDYGNVLAHDYMRVAWNNSTYVTAETDVVIAAGNNYGDITLFGFGSKYEDDNEFAYNYDDDFVPNYADTSY